MENSIAHTVPLFAFMLWVHLSLRALQKGPWVYVGSCLQNSPGTEFTSSLHSAGIKMPVTLVATVDMSVSVQRDPEISSSTAPFPSPCAGSTQISCKCGGEGKVRTRPD